MKPEDRPDPITEWVNAHPWTICYIAVIVTLLLLLNAVQVFERA